MRKHGMKRFVLLSLLALLPVLLMVAIYIIRDPFHVIKPYNGSINNTADTVQLTVNTGYFSTEAFKYFEPTRHYDSFIMGSSLSGYYRIQDWVRHLPDSVSAFHFNASRETLIGIRNKLNYLVANGATIKHVLIVMEDEMLKRQPIDQDVLFVQHPQTASNVSWWEFHQLYFNAFRHPELAAYTIWPNATTTRLALEKGYATTDIPDRIEELNEGYYGWADSIIDCNPEAFFTPEHLARYAQPMRLMPCPDKITPMVESLLNDIATILRNQGTDYQIIIPPHYAWEPISSHDLYMLELIFGQQRVHDYSHDPEMGTDLHYYYDDGHLISRECARLMDSAYHAASLPSSFLTQ
jgi:hypothetical protein